MARLSNLDKRVERLTLESLIRAASLVLVGVQLQRQLAVRCGKGTVT